jgi:hypothetical protein
MKYIITLYGLNKFAFITTLVLYVTLYLGMLFQVILGTIQLLTAAYITFFYYKKLQKENQLSLKTYWVVVAANLSLALLFFEIWDMSALFFLFLFPMIIAGYFLHILSEIKHEIIEL